MRRESLGKTYGLANNQDVFITPVCGSAEFSWWTGLICSIEKPKLINCQKISYVTFDTTRRLHADALQKLDGSERTFLILRGEHAGVIAMDNTSTRHVEYLQQRWIPADKISNRPDRSRLNHSLHARALLLRPFIPDKERWDSFEQYADIILSKRKSLKDELFRGVNSDDTLGTLEIFLRLLKYKGFKVDDAQFTSNVLDFLT